MPRELPVIRTTFPVKSKGSFMTIAALVEISGAQSTRTASRSTKYEEQRQASHSRHGAEMLGTPLATQTNTSLCKRRSHTTRPKRQDEASGIQSSGWPGKKPIRPQTLRKNEASNRARPLPIRRRMNSRPAIQRQFLAIRAARLNHVATK